MSKLITIDPDTCQDPEPEGQEYGYCMFEELPNVSMMKKVLPKANVTLNEIRVSSAGPGTDLKLDITNEKICQLQQEDPFSRRIMSLLKSSLYYIENELLMSNIIDNKQCFHTVVLPQVLTTQVLRAVLDE